MRNIYSYFLIAVLLVASSCDKGENTNEIQNPGSVTPPAEVVTKKISIMGDSYSTFKGYIPDGFSHYYPTTNRNNLYSVDQTWWHILCSGTKYELEINNSWSGSTISRTGWNGYDSSTKPFISTTRIKGLGDPDIILIFGGTNDAWIPAPLGDYKYSRWTDSDLRNLRPALAYLLSELKELYSANIYFILNSDLSEDFDSSVETICTHYDVPVLSLVNIAKEDNHPNIDGMRAISDQITKFFLYQSE